MQTNSPGLEFALALAAGLVALVVAWKSFEYVRDDLRRRREPPPGDSEPPTGE